MPTPTPTGLDTAQAGGRIEAINEAHDNAGMQVIGASLLGFIGGGPLIGIATVGITSELVCGSCHGHSPPKDPPFTNPLPEATLSDEEAAATVNVDSLLQTPIQCPPGADKVKK